MTSQENTGANAALPEDTIGGLLVRAGKLKQADLERVLQVQKEKRIRFGEAAVQLKLVSQQDIQWVLAQQFRFPVVTDAKQFDAKVVAATQPYTASVDALRTARAELLMRWFNNGHKFLAVGGASDKDGSNVLAANLAVLFAQLGMRTLLVDANLKSPGLHTLFKRQNSSGLSEMLAGRIQQLAAPSVPPFQRLSLLTAGSEPPNPSELLLQPSLLAFMEQAEQAYDVILVDTPPAAVSSDFQIVAARTGGLVLATKPQVSKLKQVADMRDKVLAAGAVVVGAVLMG